MDVKCEGMLPLNNNPPHKHSNRKFHRNTCTYECVCVFACLSGIKKFHKANMTRHVFITLMFSLLNVNKFFMQIFTDRQIQHINTPAYIHSQKHIYRVYMCGCVRMCMYVVFCTRLFIKLGKTEIKREILFHKSNL